MKEYINSLEAAGEKLTEQEWREWIAHEIEDLEKQGVKIDVDIDAVIRGLDTDGLIKEV